MKKFLELSGLFLTLSIAPTYAMEKKSKPFLKQRLIRLNTQSPLITRLKVPTNPTTGPCNRVINYTCLECRKHYTSLSDLLWHPFPHQKDAINHLVFFIIQPFTPEAHTVSFELSLPQPMDKEIDQTTLLDMQENKPLEQPSLQPTFDSSQFFA